MSIAWRFDPRQGQMLLADAGLYRSAIDGDVGPLTRAAVEASEAAAGLAPPAGWDWTRRLIAAGQRQLQRAGFAPGPADGLFGHNTHEAMTAWLSRRVGTDPSVPRPSPAAATSRDPMHQAKWPAQADVPAFFGPAGGPLCTAGRCDLPFAFPLAWDLFTQVRSFACHTRVAGPLTWIFSTAASHYGEEHFRLLRLDRFGGCFNHRTMRGGTALSMHSWGIAVDLDPERNQLRWGRDRAAFAHPDYDPWWRIVEAAGATSLGRACNFDWMHFQFARP